MEQNVVDIMNAVTAGSGFWIFALPPMDYVSEDGTPAGFNTAILAELGKRMNKNFELVQVDSLGWAPALTSGKVDLVFWTNGSDGRSPGARQTPEEHEE